MPLLRVVITDPELGSVSQGPLSLAVQQDGKKRYLVLAFDQLADGPEPAEAGVFRALCAHQRLGEPELLTDSPAPAPQPEPPQPAAPAVESAPKEA